MPKKPNIQNEKTCINFMWLYDFQRLIATEKIIKGEKIEIQDIIPNNEEIEMYIENYGKNKGAKEERYKTIFFAQNIVSWAINFSDNPVRLVIHPIYSYILNDEDIERIYEIKNLDERKMKIRELCEQRIQEKYNTKMTLEEIETKYEECFKEFEKEVQKYNKNFSIIKFEDLVNEYLAEEEIEKDEMLKYLVKEDCLYIRKIFSLNVFKYMGSAIDAMRICLNYYGMGYEKNLTIDMDNTVGNLNIDYSRRSKIPLNSEYINKLGDDAKFPYIGGDWCENSLLYTAKSHDKTIEEIRSQCKHDEWKQELDSKGSIFYATGKIFEEKVQWNDRNGINDYKEESKHLIGYTDHYSTSRTFNESNLTTKEKTNLPIIYEENFWPQDEFFQQTENSKMYVDNPKTQKIVHEIYGKYTNPSLDGISKNEIREAKTLN